MVPMSRQPSFRQSPNAWLLLAVAAIVCVAATHAVVLSFGFRYDDYMMLRPFGDADVRQALTNSWGPIGGGQDSYYRPITALYLGGLFQVFGLHAWPMHLVSLVELAVVGWLLGVFLYRDLGLKVALLGVVVYLLRPSLPDSTSAWILNQMHLLALIVVTATLLVWQSRRQDPRPVRWLPIFLLTALGVFIKEDTAMILPALLALQWARARFVKDVPGLNTELVTASIVFAALLVALRLWMFPHFDVFEPGPSRPWSRILAIAAYAPVRASMVVFLRGSLVVGATAFVLLTEACGGWTFWRRPASERGWLWIQGVILLACFSLPIGFVADFKTTRMHLVVFSSTMMLTAGISTILAWRPSRRWLAAAAMLVVVAGIGDRARLQHTELVERFTPCGEEDLWFDQDVRAWPIVTDDLKRWIDLKARACSEGRYQPLEFAMDQLHWSRGDDHVLLVHRDAQSISLDLQAAPLDADSETVRVTIDGVTRTLQLHADTRTTVTYRLSKSWRARWRAAHRIDIDVDAGSAPITLSAVRLGWPAGILGPMGAR